MVVLQGILSVGLLRRARAHPRSDSLAGKIEAAGCSEVGKAPGWAPGGSVIDALVVLGISR
eukprot:2825842-Pyramimonas_sp.AAC.1